MITDNFIENGNKTKLGCMKQFGNLAKFKKLDFGKAYRLWESVLLERIMNVFTWENLGFPQKEIEILLNFVGFCGVIKDRDGLLAVNGGMSGVTNYPDEFTQFVWATPLKNGINQIHKNIVVINNNQIRFATYKVVEYYAILLAHADLSLQAALINTRSTGMAKARTQQQVDSINSFYNALTDGKTLAILDAENLNALMNDDGIKVFANDFPSAFNIDQYYQVHTNLMKSFYAEIGLNTLRDKRERMVANEVDADINHLMFNVSDMLKERQTACEEINKLFGTNVTVDYSPEIKRQFETGNEISPTKSEERSSKDAVSRL